MEPINCTAQVTKNRVQLWAPTQVATLAQLVAARAAGVSRDQVHIEIPLIGGGFGRRLESDFVGQAVTIAARTAGRPVQVIWSREDDIKHDFYRPQAIARLKARVENGRVTAIASRSAGQSILAGELERLFGAPSLDIDRYTAKVCSTNRMRSSTNTLRIWWSTYRYPSGSGAASATRTRGSSSKVS